ncbi:MAG: peptide chain release factor N(5)-glutamine methyltransferase [Candidatus Omnitrophota bacterium]|nr:peptide chain release factor N(5)-glutamine methyltransferase [Candidatus Omnitrophota bacterium]
MTEKEILLSSIFNCSRSALYSQEWSLTAAQAKKLSEALFLRSQGVPLQYILGEVEFFGLVFQVDSRVLIPRPETEILVETVLKKIKNQKIPVCRQTEKIKILDVGTGSGCIAISLAKFLTFARVTAIDMSGDALSAAKENASKNSVRDRINFLPSDLFSVFKKNNVNNRLGNYDIIISNPPYVRSGDINGLQKELAYEPRMALDGGEDGLDFYRRVIAEAGNFLNKEGLLFLEIGFNQREDIEKIVFAGNDFAVDEIIKDYSGIERVMILRKHGKVSN